MSLLTPAELAALKKFDSPTISNAIEGFKVRPRNEGFMGPEIKCIQAVDEPVVGYAYTGKISAVKPPTDAEKALRFDYWKGVLASPKPTISVLQDVDPEPIGSFWGEVNGSIHRALGCIATITSGGVRDLDEVREIGFSYFANCVLVSHAYVHLVEIGCPVEVGGLLVHPGDLLHADKHGVVLIPKEIAKEVAAAAERVVAAEEPVIKYCREKFDGGIDVEKLRVLMEEMDRRRG